MAVHLLQAELNEVLGEDQKASQPPPSAAQVQAITPHRRPWWSRAALALSAQGPWRPRVWQALVPGEGQAQADMGVTVLSTQICVLRPPPHPTREHFLQPKPTALSPGVGTTLHERLRLYQAALESARQAGDSAKMRRYDRGLKVSQ